MPPDADKQTQSPVRTRVSKKPKLRVLLADDDGEVASAVEALLGGDYEIVARVRDGQSLVREVGKLHPDVAIVDISMPLLNGIEATRRITSTSTGVKVIILTVHDEPAYVEAAFEAGARGYVLKFDARDELIPAIAAVTSSHSYRSLALG
jgi:DNA-binding NarL/FixJ family response regulator